MRGIKYSLSCAYETVVDTVLETCPILVVLCARLTFNFDIFYVSYVIGKHQNTMCLNNCNTYVQYKKKQVYSRMKIQKTVAASHCLHADKSSCQVWRKEEKGINCEILQRCRGTHAGSSPTAVPL